MQLAIARANRNQAVPAAFDMHGRRQFVGLLMLITIWSGPVLAQSIAPAGAAPGTTSEPDAKPSSRADFSVTTPLSTSVAPQGGSSTTPPPTDPSHALADHRPLDEAVRGVVADEVMTLVGQDFYSAFVSAWRDFPLADRYNVSIYERPSARWGSLVWVEYQHRRLFEAFLAPTRTGIREIGARAASQVNQQLVRADLDRLLFRDPDLAPDEM